MEAQRAGAGLRNADLQEAHLSRVNLRDTRLDGANLCRVNLSCADLRGAILVGAETFGLRLPGRSSIARLT